jgi:hypothetical protein
MAEKRKCQVILNDSDEAESGQEEEEEEEELPPAKSNRAKKATWKKSASGEIFIHVPNLNVDCQLVSDKENVASEAKKIAALKKQVANLTRKMKKPNESAPSKGNVTYFVRLRFYSQLMNRCW